MSGDRRRDGVCLWVGVHNMCLEYSNNTKKRQGNRR